MITTKSLGLHRLYGKAAVLSFKGIHNGSAVLARRGSERTTYIKHEPGTRFRDTLMESENKEFKKISEQFEDDADYEEDFDFMNMDKAYDDHIRGDKRNKHKLGQIITKQKFFKSRPQPQMLTYQERECIKYLHKQDPVQWNVKILSESFPATPEVISKILKSKVKTTPERAKVMDSKVQQNWSLLKEGKLDADPHVLEHLKKFVNRREVLLEQIKNEDIYLPEIKSEPVWNQGELNGILTHYEKEIQKLAAANNSQGTKLIREGAPKIESNSNEDMSATDYLHQKIKNVGRRMQFNENDSFVLGEMINTYAKERTLDEVEDQILQKAETRKPLRLVEKAILEKKLGRPSYTESEKLPESSLQRTQKIQERDDNRDLLLSAKQRKGVKKLDYGEEFVETGRGYRVVNSVQTKPKRYTEEKEEEEEEEEKGILFKHDNRTHVCCETGVGKLLNKLQNRAKPKEEVEEVPKKEKKVTLGNTDQESLKLDSAFYDREVADIKNTSFWKNEETSEEKALAERKKQSYDALAYNSRATNIADTPVFKMDTYPERINIPVNYRGSGLTFRIKDCYYDDDGEFLYKVPGMTKF